MREPDDDADRDADGHAPRASRDRRDRVRRDRRQQWSVVGIALVVGLIAGSLGTTRGHSARALGRPAPTPTTVPAPSAARAVLLAHVNSKHRLDLLAVAGVAKGGHVGSIVFVPTTTLVEVPSFDNQALLGVPALGQSSLLATTVANALGLRFHQVIVMGNRRLTAALAPAKHLDIGFSRSVRVDDSAGTLSFTAGTAHVSAADATRLLIGSDAGGSLEHLVTVQDVLQGWFARLRDPAVAHATMHVFSAASALVRLAHARLQYDTLPVDVLSTGTVTRYEMRQPDANAMLKADFPYALLAQGRRPRVEVLNGTGAIALTQAVARRVVPAGGEITLTGNVPGFGVRHTTVVYYRASERPEARRLAAALGVGRVAEGNVALDVVDLTIVVGSDFHPTRG